MAIAARYKGYRYPIEVIGHAVWLYHRFALSLRDVEELMLPAVWWSPTRRSGPGVRSSGRTTLPSYVGGDPPRRQMALRRGVREAKGAQAGCGEGGDASAEGGLRCGVRQRQLPL